MRIIIIIMRLLISHNIMRPVTFFERLKLTYMHAYEDLSSKGVGI